MDAMNRVFVKPAPGLKVRQPEKQGKPLPEDGAFVNWTPYWIRRQNSGDITVDPSKIESAPAPARAKAEKKQPAKKEG